MLKPTISQLPQILETKDVLPLSPVIAFSSIVDTGVDWCKKGKMRISFAAVPLLSLVPTAIAFTPPQQSSVPVAFESVTQPRILTFLKSAEDDEEKKSENPYQDPNYPELEFVNYDDPEYKVDQGVGDEFYDPQSTEEKIEAMREERRLRNDEFQFETYYRDTLKEGAEYKGEWTIYHSSTFMEGVDSNPLGIPTLKKAAKPLRVITRGERVQVDSSGNSEFRLDNERLLHIEKIFSESSGEKSAAQLEQEERSMNTKYWPAELSARDFRGHQGIMCVGNGYTICTATQLEENSENPHDGPFSEYRCELGIQSDPLRFRIKLDYSILEEDKKGVEFPPLHLRSMTVCREALEMWPRAENYKSAIEAVTERAFYGPPGAAGGLYDPPPVGSDEQAGQYMMLDLDGGATVLIPFLMDQDPAAHDEYGWVTSLDWSPGKFRFQVDRKTRGGKAILGLRTLELSEVQSADAAEYRPRDGGADMRQ